MRFNSELKNKLLIIYQSGKLALRLVILDQVTKWWFILYLKKKPAMTLKISNFLEFVYVWNYGISFGLFKNYYQYSNAVFIALNSIITAYLWYILLHCKSALSFTGYSFIIGGAAGNLIDRCFRGAVFDFIYFHYRDYGFPVFNLADSFISIGVMLIIYDHYKMKKIVEKSSNKFYDSVEIEAERIRKLDDNNINLEVKQDG